MAKDTVKQYQDLIKEQKEVYAQIIKGTKPNFLKKLFDSVGFISIGVLTGVLAL